MKRMSSSEYKSFAQKKIKESDLQALCVRWFRAKYPKYRRLLFAIPNGANLKNGYRSWAKLKKEGAVAGAADLLLAVPSGDIPGLSDEKTAGIRARRRAYWRVRVLHYPFARRISKNRKRIFRNR